MAHITLFQHWKIKGIIASKFIAEKKDITKNISAEKVLRASLLLKEGITSKCVAERSHCEAVYWLEINARKFIAERSHCEQVYC